jgi:hypothetical protein
MTLPEAVRKEVLERVWRTAGELGWRDLSKDERSRYYDEWAQAPDIGQVLARYMDPSEVRHYIKDTIIKPYARAELADLDRPARVLHIQPGTAFAESYIKPHGRRLADGRVFCWGQAKDWKAILMAAYERAFHARNARPYGVVLLNSAHTLAQPRLREMVEDIARRLEIERVVWLDS